MATAGNIPIDRMKSKQTKIDNFFKLLPSFQLIPYIDSDENADGRMSSIPSNKSLRKYSNFGLYKVKPRVSG
jgi:hypothetical protein